MNYDLIYRGDSITGRPYIAVSTAISAPRQLLCKYMQILSLVKDLNESQL